MLAINLTTAADEILFHLYQDSGFILFGGNHFNWYALVRLSRKEEFAWGERLCIVVSLFEEWITKCGAKKENNERGKKITLGCYYIIDPVGHSRVVHHWQDGWAGRASLCLVKETCPRLDQSGSSSAAASFLLHELSSPRSRRIDQN